MKLKEKKYSFHLDITKSLIDYDGAKLKKQLFRNAQQQQQQGGPNHQQIQLLAQQQYLAAQAAQQQGKYIDTCYV
ncbi:putative Pumilio 2-like 2 [Homarus americanus]|uniref:Putative Pumilio 2-like 2 n=1 Tax=Homarus americanus TaxID=6706 RepID=A0A8J5JVK8_HOMAM|nr:putative Pumilio 2-like 2 [Homarus americanus]